MEFQELQKITESIAKSVQALTDDITEFKLTVAADHEAAREERAELRRATIGIANLLSSLDEDRPTILRKLNAIETKVDRILARENGSGDELPG